MDMYLEIIRFDDIPPALANEDQTKDNVTIIPIELTNTTGTYLQHLNEDCLLEIFSSNSLTPMDLCSLAETCTRFKRITQRVFPNDYDIRNKWSGYQFTSKNYNKDCLRLQNVDRILKNFGQHLSRLQVDWDLSVVNLVEKYCGDVALKRLDISYLQNIEVVRLRLNSIFQRMLELYIYNCDLQVTSPDLNCDSLTGLKIERTSGCAAVLEHNFPKLEQFDFIEEICSKMDKNTSEILLEFIRRHGHLKTIYLDGESFYNCEFLHVVGISCKDLERLALRYYNTSFDLSHLQNLAGLKVLDVDFAFGQHDQPHCQHIEPSRVFKSLETIKIQRMVKVPLQFFDVLLQLPSLRRLYLKNCAFGMIPWATLTQLREVYLNGSYVRFADVIHIIRQLINLEKLKMNIYLVDEHFYEIVKIVEGREHVLTLECYCWLKHEENGEGNQNVRLIKRKPALNKM